jgi:hypothetical protein
VLKVRNGKIVLSRQGQDADQEWAPGVVPYDLVVCSRRGKATVFGPRGMALGRTP